MRIFFRSRNHLYCNFSSSWIMSQIIPENKTLFVIDRYEWRDWLENNHDKEDEVWLIHYKKHTRRASINFEEALQEALCYGWIDSMIRRLDEHRYMLKFSPRKKRSSWSEANKKRVRILTMEGRMTPAGLTKVEEAKKNGSWHQAEDFAKRYQMPAELKESLEKEPQALRNFLNFAPSYQKGYIAWVNKAKKDETKWRRIESVVQRSLQNMKPGIK